MASITEQEMGFYAAYPSIHYPRHPPLSQTHVLASASYAHLG